jgi:hypothetical protein
MILPCLERYLVIHYNLDEESEYAEWNLAMQENEITFDMLIPNFFRYSFIVLLNIVIENELRKLCYVIQQEKGIEIDPPTSKKNIIKNYKDYIHNKCGVSPIEWENTLELNKVRNCIVHSSGKVSNDDHEEFLRDCAKKRNGLYVSARIDDLQRESIPLYYEDDMLVIEPDYCKFALLGTKHFFEELCDAIPLPKSSFRKS